MADFFSKLKNNINKGAKVLGTHSNSMIEVGKVKAELNALKKSKNKAFSAIGEKIYETVSSEAEIDDIQQLVGNELAALKELDVSIGEKEELIKQIEEEKEAKLEEIDELYEEKVVVEDATDMEAKEVEIEVEPEVEPEVEDRHEEYKTVPFSEEEEAEREVTVQETEEKQ